MSSGRLIPESEVKLAAEEGALEADETTGGGGDLYLLIRGSRALGGGKFLFNAGMNRSLLIPSIGTKCGALVHPVDGQGGRSGLAV